MTPDNFRERFGTPSHPEGCPVLIAAALVRAEAENAKLLEAPRDAELIAARELLRRWVTKYAPGNQPGAWEYDRDAVELIETSARLIGIENPWR